MEEEIPGTLFFSEGLDILSCAERQGEYTRLLISALNELGYTKASQSLLEESGINEKEEMQKEFQRCFLLGEYSAALLQLLSMPMTDSDKRVIHQIYHRLQFSL